MAIAFTPMMERDSDKTAKKMLMCINEKDELHLFFVCEHVDKRDVEKMLENVSFRFSVKDLTYHKYILFMFSDKWGGITMLQSEPGCLQQIKDDSFFLNIVDEPKNSIVARFQIPMEKGFAKQINQLLEDDDNSLSNWYGFLGLTESEEFREFISLPLTEMFKHAQYHFEPKKED